MLFEQKKIQSETLSEYLLSVRQNLKLSLETVAAKTGISIRFLNSLECGDFSSLPADVYVQGFLRQLAGLYMISAEELAAQYQKEKNIHNQVLKQAALKSSWYQKIFGRVVLTPRILSVAVGTGFVAITVLYIFWQVWSINKTPSLEIISPQNNSVIENASLDVQGKTDPGMSVTINGQDIFVETNGGFDKEMGLVPGAKTIVVTASNHFGKSVTQALNVTGATVASSGTNVTLKINFTEAAVLSVAIDDQSPQTLSFNAGDSKTFMANSKIILSTSNAAATNVNLNGQQIGALGKANEQLSNIPFFAPNQPATTTTTK